MPLLRPSPQCLRLPQRPSPGHPIQPITAVASTKSLTSTPHRTLASSSHPPDAAEHSAPHESHYDPPSGWLFGVPPGQKYQKEGWENTWVYGFWGSLLFGVVAYAYKPDTSIQTWALEEARRRLEAEGILEDPSPEAGKK
ncbi:MAG: hypothetical protein Q9163_003498 [Psora crenata]